MTADDFVQRVAELVRGLKKEIADLEGLISEAEGHRGRIRDQLALYEQALAVYRQVMDLPRTPEEQLPLVGGLRGTIADMSEQIIEARGEPVTVRDLVNVLRAAGKFRNPDKDRANYGTVYGTLQRDERFIKVRGKGQFYLVRLLRPESPLVVGAGEQDKETN